ncbi:MAG: DMT family transporter [Candidatus Dasytiphilus stammeri]
MNINISKQVKIVFLFIIVSLAWGTTWMATKISVQTIPPIFATGLRFLCASPVLLLIALIKKIPLLLPVGSRHFQCTISLCYFIIPFTLMFYGGRYTSAGLAAIIFATMPVVVLLTSILISKVKTSFQQTLGLLISTISITGILWKETNHSHNNDIKGIIALIIAVFMHSLMYVFFKKRGDQSIITSTTLPCLVAGILLTFIGYQIEKPIYDNISLSSLLSIVYLGIVSNVFGMISYFALQKLTRPFQASLVFIVFPVIAILLDSLFNKIIINITTFLLIISLTIGIIMIVSSPNHATKKHIRT